MNATIYQSRQLSFYFVCYDIKVNLMDTGMTHFAHWTKETHGNSEVQSV